MRKALFEGERAFPILKVPFESLKVLSKSERAVRSMNVLHLHIRRAPSHSKSTFTFEKHVRIRKLPFFYPYPFPRNPNVFEQLRHVVDHGDRTADEAECRECVDQSLEGGAVDAAARAGPVRFGRARD